MEVGRLETEGKDSTISEATDEINLSKYQEPTAEEDAAIALRKEQIKAEVTELEDDIQTLKTALARKEAHLAELKKELGVTRWSQFRDGVSQKYQAYQSSQVYSKLSAASTTTKQSLGAAGEKTSAAFKSFGSATAKKWQDIRDSPTFHSMEEKMWATTGAIKAKLGVQKPDPAVTPSETNGSSAQPSAI
eukprot:gene12298-13566_t